MFRSCFFIIFLLLCACSSEEQKVSPEVDVDTYYHVLVTGQSLSTGSWGVSSLSGSYSDSQPYSNYMLSQSSIEVNLQGPLGSIAPLIPLVEPYYEFAIKELVETPITGIANTFAALDNPVNPSYSVVATGHGLGAQPYSQIKKHPVTTSPPFLQRYEIGQRQISQVYKELSTNPDFPNAEYRPVGIVVIHGETDQLLGNALPYEGYLNELQLDYESDMMQLLSQNNEPSISSLPMFVTQMNSRGPAEMAIAQLNAARNNPEIYMVGPTYQYTFYDKTHLHGAAEYRHLGEQIGKVMYEVSILNKNWKPLMPEEISYSKKLVKIQFHVPVGALTFDAPSHSIDSLTDLKHYYKNYGFEYVDDSNSAQIVPESVIIGFDKKSVYFYLDKEPIGTNPRIRYAAQQYPGIASGASAGC